VDDLVEEEPLQESVGETVAPALEDAPVAVEAAETVVAPAPAVETETETEAEEETETPPADLLPSPTEPDDLDRQLTQDEEMERQNRHQHHETPHFRKESD
jgi:hypothetical protein